VRVTGVPYHYNRDTAPDEGYTLRPRIPQDVVVIKLADKVPPAPGGHGKDLGAVSIATAHSTRTGNYVLVGGVVTVPPGVIGTSDFWIQDESGGVHVYVAAPAGAMPLLHLWDKVTVRGRVVTYFGEREVRVEEPSSIGVFGVGAPIAPRRVQSGALTLKDEGILAELAGAVTRIRGRDIYVDDGSGEARVYLDPDSHVDVPPLKAGDAVIIAGVVRRYANAPELVPRFPTDLRYEAKANTKGTKESTKAAKPNTKTAKGSAGGNASEAAPVAITVMPTLTATPGATAEVGIPSVARVLRRPMLGATVRTAQAGLTLRNTWEMPFAAALFLLFSTSGLMALAAVWNYRRGH
jgi:DNA/RNA endonuclease YhcR with UshA esterase domain